jgi:YbbR domain-containing protein
VAQRAKSNHTRSGLPRTRTFGTAAVTARNRFSWLWSRESLLRLILSFVLAVALWLYVTDKQNPSQAWDYPVPLNVTSENVPHGLVVTNGLKTVQLRLEADRNAVAVSQASFHPFVDLQGLKRGLHRVQVHVATDPGITVLSTTPASIPVSLDRMINAHVPISVQITDKLPTGYTLGTVTVKPNTLDVSGPQATVSQVTKAIVPLYVGGATSTISGPYKPFPVDASGASVPPNQLRLSPAQVQVTAPISSLSSYKTLPVIVALRGQPRAGFGVSGVTVNPSSVTAYGSPAHLKGVSSVLTAPVTVSNRKQGTFTQRVRIRLPRGLGANTDIVTVRTQVRPVAGSSSIEAAVVPENVTKGLLLHTNPDQVLVTVVGPSNSLGNAARQIRAILNLATLGAGTYSLHPQVTAPKGLKVENVYPQRVTVTLGTQ